MTIEQTVEIPASHRLTLEIPPEIPAGKAQIVLLIDSVSHGNGPADVAAYLAAHSPRTIEEALKEAERKCADPNRKPLSRLFGSHPGFFGGDGLAYQEKVRSEWDNYGWEQTQHDKT
ncbi:MAG: hypothetical protein LBU00_00030 [Treponema sp.]|jgi:hypothetical protein|nr:hypothetical protein [Treponema sp.]